MTTLYIFHWRTSVDSICEDAVSAAKAEEYFESHGIKINLVTIQVDSDDVDDAWRHLDYMLDGIWKQNNTGKFPQHAH